MNGRRVRVAAVSGLTLTAPRSRPGERRREPGLDRPAELLVGCAHAVALRRPRVPGDRQRRLHQPAHRRAHGLRRAGEPVPARQPRRADRLRATQCLTDFSLDFERTAVDAGRRPGHDGQLGRRQRRGRRRSSSCSRPTPATRTGRTTPTRSPTRPRRSTRSAARTTTRCHRPARRR